MKKILYIFIVLFHYLIAENSKIDPTIYDLQKLLKQRQEIQKEVESMEWRMVKIKLLEKELSKTAYGSDKNDKLEQISAEKFAIRDYEIKRLSLDYVDEKISFVTFRLQQENQKLNNIKLCDSGDKELFDECIAVERRFNLLVSNKYRDFRSNETIVQTFQFLHKALQRNEFILKLYNNSLYDFYLSKQKEISKYILENIANELSDFKLTDEVAIFGFNFVYQSEKLIVDFIGIKDNKLNIIKMGFFAKDYLWSRTNEVEIDQDKSKMTISYRGSIFEIPLKIFKNFISAQIFANEIKSELFKFKREPAKNFIREQNIRLFNIKVE